MKKSNKNKFGKTSIHSMIRMAQISEYGFNEILPKILLREDEHTKKIKKKKQNNIKHSNSANSKSHAHKTKK
jgi:hypothetical protein